MNIIEFETPVLPIIDIYKNKTKYDNIYGSDTTKCIQIYTSSKIKNIHININI